MGEPPGDAERAWLSSSQRRIVACPTDAGHLLVLAGPGAGKTRTIVERIDRLLRGGHCRPEQVLALTFTVEAARELSDRLAARAHAGVTTGTFHHFCARLLTEHGTAVGVAAPLRIYDERRQEAALLRAAGQIGFPLGQRGTPAIPALLAHVGRRKLAGLSPGDWPLGRDRDREVLADQIAALDERYDGILRELGGLDYADLIVLGLRLLREDEAAATWVHGRFRFVFVDEFHDLSPDQSALLRLIAPPGARPRRPAVEDDEDRLPAQVMVVADPEQGIFGWRDANPRATLTAYRRDYRPTPFHLVDIFRSTATIVRAASALRPDRATGPPLRPTAGDGLPILCFGFPDGEREAAGLVGLIRRAQEVGRYRLDDVAVLYRVNRRADLAEAALLRAGVRIRRVQRDRFFDQPAVQESLRYLDLVASLNDPSFAPALNWPRVLVDELTMVHLRRLARARGSTLAALAEGIDGLGEAVSPLTRVAIEEFRTGIAADLRPALDGPLPAVIDALLALLARRRSPIPSAERANLRGVLDFLGQSLDRAVATLRQAIAARLPVTLLHRGDVDTAAAAAILEHVLGRYLRHPVTVLPAGEPAAVGALTIVLGEQVGSDEDRIGLAPRVTRRLTYSVATLAWRLGQMLLMGYETLHQGRFVVYDLETGGDHAGTTELLEVAALRLEDGAIRDERFASLIRPSGPGAICHGAEQVHGIGWQDVRDAPTPAEALPDLLAFLGEETTVGHNIDDFDGRVLVRVCADLGLPPPPDLTIDTCNLARRLLPDEPHGLEALARRVGLLGAAAVQAHRAAPDCDLVAGVFRELLALERAERELDVLGEALPLVACSILAGGPARDETETLLRCGARGLAFGQGTALLARFRALLADQSAATSVEGWLRAVDHAVPDDDDAWTALGRNWRETTAAYLGAGGAPTLDAFLAYAARATPLDEGPDAPGRLTMMTIHSAKGKEWPLVFVIGVEDGVLPDYRNVADEDLLAEERRVLYVGITRAKRQVCLLWAAESGGRDRRCSRFLTALPPGLIEHRPREIGP